MNIYNTKSLNSNLLNKSAHIEDNIYLISTPLNLYLIYEYKSRISTFKVSEIDLSHSFPIEHKDDNDEIQLVFYLNFFLYLIFAMKSPSELIIRRISINNGLKWELLVLKVPTYDLYYTSILCQYTENEVVVCCFNRIHEEFAFLNLKLKSGTSEELHPLFDDKNSILYLNNNIKDITKYINISSISFLKKMLIIKQNTNKFLIDRKDCTTF